MLSSNESKVYELVWQFNGESIDLLPVLCSKMALEEFFQRRNEARKALFFNEVAALAPLLEVGGKSIVWVAEYQADFWRLELLRPLFDRLVLRLVRVPYGEALCRILTKGIIPPAIFEKALRMERVIIHLDARSSYRVDSIGGALSEETGIVQQDELEGLLQRMLYHRSTALFDISLRTNRILQITDIAYHQGEQYYLAINITPISHEERRIIISIFFVSMDEFYRIQLQRSSDSGTQQEQASPGIAFFAAQLRPDGRPEFGNSSFHEMLPEGQYAAFFAMLALHLAVGALGTVRFEYRPKPWESLECFSERTAQGLLLIFWKEHLVLSEAMNGCLTRREREIAQCLCEGSPLRYIASQCGISEGTVKKTASNIYRKLGVTSRVDLLQRLIR